MISEKDMLEAAYQKQVEAAYVVFVQSYTLAKGDVHAIDHAARKFGKALDVQRTILARAIKTLPG